jgi:Tfp pilus assembly protein PilV
LWIKENKMAATITWKINQMQRTTADGGVTEVRWECSGVDGDARAVEAGKYTCTYDASASSFIKYDDLKESDVIGWVKSACDAQSDERMKVDTIEKRLTEKCAAQIEKAKTKSTGVPW